MADAEHTTTLTRSDFNEAFVPISQLLSALKVVLNAGEDVIAQHGNFKDDAFGAAVFLAAELTVKLEALYERVDAALFAKQEARDAKL